MKLIEAMLCWNPGKAEVMVVSHTDPREIITADKLQNSSLACYGVWESLTAARRRELMLMEALQLIVRDKCDAEAVHRALLRIDEYVEFCADDMPGLPEHELARRNAAA